MGVQVNEGKRLILIHGHGFLLAFFVFFDCRLAYRRDIYLLLYITLFDCSRKCSRIYLVYICLSSTAVTQIIIFVLRLAHAPMDLLQRFSDIIDLW